MSTATKVTIKPNLKTKQPKMFKVIYLNDDVTTMDFVVGSLVTFFDHSEPSAMDITYQIHQSGSAVVALLPHEIAEQKHTEVLSEAQSQGFPLQVKIEADA
jgi:ATP-dependent Clp protease adaptor protein ClpS